MEQLSKDTLFKRRNREKGEVAELVEGTALEKRQGCKPFGGSNPPLSAFVLWIFEGFRGIFNV